MTRVGVATPTVNRPKRPKSPDPRRKRAKVKVGNSASKFAWKPDALAIALGLRATPVR